MKNPEEQWYEFLKTHCLITYTKPEIVYATIGNIATILANLNTPIPTIPPYTTYVKVKDEDIDYWSIRMSTGKINSGGQLLCYTENDYDQTMTWDQWQQIDPKELWDGK